MTARESRGWRNNNPLNLEYSPRNRWQGQTGTDGRFSTFVNREYGYRAGLIILRNYQRKYNLRTLAGMITRWCPPQERGNNTPAYIRSVSERTGLRADEPVDLQDEETVVRLLDAMTRVECGRAGDTDAIKRAFEMTTRHA